MLAIFVLIGGVVVIERGAELAKTLKNFLPASLQLSETLETGRDEGTASSNLKTNQESYSFVKDDDGDGLSNAKEIIYGSDLLKKDTDGDSYSDGDEVRAGFDPTKSGQSKIGENTAYQKNSTIQYFLWQQSKSGEPDPQIDVNAIQEFFTTTGEKAPFLTSVDDAELRISQKSGADAISAYLAAVSAVPLPTTSVSYFEVASEAIDGDTRNVEKGVNQLDFIEQQYRAIEVPREALELHKTYVGMFRTLKGMFATLLAPQRDPVRLVWNLRLGQKLVETGKNIEIQKQELTKKYGL